MSYAFRKSDANQKRIVETLRSVPGVSVFVTTIVKHGFPDLVVGFRGVTYLVELKTEKGKLTDDERDFFDSWTGQITIARSAEDILDMIGAI